MKITLKWLKEYLDTEATIEEITSKLTSIGLEVEEVSNPTAGLKDFIIAEIKEVNDHPNADKLHILKVDTGKEVLQIVCGAPNVRVGLKGVLARPGVKIPVSGDILKVGSIRGVESFGMMCSARELKLGEDHTGILDLTTDAPLGSSFSEVLGGDIVIDINVTPNRPDCFGVLGIARDLAASGIGRLKDLSFVPVEGKFSSPIKVKLLPSGCSIFTGRYIRGVKNVSSPQWLQDRLSSVGLRPISALVDITNYLNIGRCRPLHVFDAKKIRGDIEVRYAREGEKLVTLDGKEHVLTSEMTVISDSEEVLSLAGIMGGEKSGVSEHTTEVFLESAWFDPMSIARTGRFLNIESDSRTRFERGVDSASSIPDNEIATRLILDLCGGEASEIVIAGEDPRWEREIQFRSERVKTLCGVDVSREESEKILTSLGFKVKGDRVFPPSWRPDIEGEADLVEEVMRIYGYDKLPALSMISKEMPKVLLSPVQKKEMSARRALAERGGYQAITWSFMSSERAKFFNSKGVRLGNPIASDLDEMRPSLIPNLIDAAKRNLDRGYPNVALFEVGPQFIGSKPGEQEAMASIVRIGKNHGRHWLDVDREVDVFDVKEDAIATLGAVDAPLSGLQVYRNAPSYYHPGRSGSLCLGKTVLAYFGEIHPNVLRFLDIKERVVAAEVFLDKVPSKELRSKNQKAIFISSFQPLFRDFAFVMDSEVEAEKILKVVRGVDKNLISDVQVFDLYEGDRLGKGKKSLAIEVTIQPQEKTLTDLEIEDLSNKVVEAVKVATGAELRR